MNTNYLNHLELAIKGLTALRGACQSLEGKDLGKRFREAIAAVCKADRVCTAGIGKSGHIARKCAATLSSLGTPSYFVSCGEALHGDLGAISPRDAVLLFSHSGNSPEIKGVIDHCQWLQVPIIGITGNGKSVLAKSSTVPIVYPEIEEFWFKAPTTSSVMQLVIGDVIAVSVAEQKGYRAEDFLQRHPGGAIGKESKWRVQKA